MLANYRFGCVNFRNLEHLRRCIVCGEEDFPPMAYEKDLKRGKNIFKNANTASLHSNDISELIL